VSPTAEKKRPEDDDPFKNENDGEMGVRIFKQVTDEFRRNPEYLTAEQINQAAHEERVARLAAQSKKSSRAPYPLKELHRQMDHLLYEVQDPPLVTEGMLEFSQRLTNKNHEVMRDE